jgi:hypothetical protein
MTMRLLALCVLSAGCYAPKVQTGAPCDDAHPCPSSLVCAQATQTCETMDSIVPPDASIDARIDAAPADGCTPTGFDVCNDGIDQDCVGGDAVCVSNDRPGDAIDATNGITATVDMFLATDDTSNEGCNGDGGHDVFYKVTINGPEVYYVDTFGSDHDTSVRIFAGVACTALQDKLPTECDDDSCGGGASQLAASLPAGTSCIVADQNANQNRSDLHIRIVRGGRDGTPLGNGLQTRSGNTCDAQPVMDPADMCAEPNAQDEAFFFFACPNDTVHLDASTCDATTDFDSVLYVREVGAVTDIDCNDDADAGCPVHDTASIITNVPFTGPGMAWLVVDGFTDGSCGTYKLTTDLN